ncbi:MAG: HupE/UreJ family protein [Myxococcales bacterium]|nr:HupE/UreJ family protein [Myxococcales bacterium]
MRCSAPLAILLAVLGWVVPSQLARAHGRSHSYSSWEIESGGAQVRVRIPLLELTRLPFGPSARGGTTPALARYVTEHVRMFVSGEVCPLAGPARTRTTPDGWAVYAWSVVCTTDRNLTIQSGLLLDVLASHLHFARVALPDGTVLERVLSETSPSWEVETTGAERSPSPPGASLPGYLMLGIQHILSGWDHLVFVLALIFLASTLAEVATLVTGFTVAHSVTLGLAVLGVVRPEGVAVEALIGFSIVLVAAENIWLLAGRDRVIPIATTAALAGMALLAGFGVGILRPLTLIGLALFSFCHFALLDRVDRPARLRIAVAFAFGLVHGFGFAGVLAEMDLPRGRLVPALFGFNLGVEVGQIAVVVLIWPLLRLLSRTRAMATIAELSSAGIAGLGLFWFITRTFG